MGCIYLRVSGSRYEFIKFIKIIFAFIALRIFNHPGDSRNTYCSPQPSSELSSYSPIKSQIRLIKVRCFCWIESAIFTVCSITGSANDRAEKSTWLAGVGCRANTAVLVRHQSSGFEVACAVPDLGSIRVRGQWGLGLIGWNTILTLVMSVVVTLHTRRCAVTTVTKPQMRDRMFSATARRSSGAAVLPEDICVLDWTQ